jgi:hypothetical protein
MSKVAIFLSAGQLALPAQSKHGKRNTHGLTTGDYRRLLSQLSQRPSSQRAFLRKLLRRALSTGAPARFPVTSRDVHNPVNPS